MNTTTGFSVEVTSQTLGRIMEAIRESGTPTRLTLNGMGAVLFVQDGLGQVRSAAMLERRLREIDSTVQVRRVSNI